MKLYRKYKLSVLTTAVVSSLSTTPTALAQEETNADEKEIPAMLEKIVVSARKREETIQESPLSIQAFSADQLEARGIDELSELTDFTPGLTMNGGTSRANSDFSVRGMTQAAATGDNRRDLVTVFLDGVPILGTPAAIGTEDLARVEVIKGPQSALFGRATFGGAISMVTSNPSDLFGGNVGVTVGSYGERKFQGMVEGPLIDDMLSARVAYQKSDFDGFYKNSLGGDLGATDQEYFSGALYFTPTDNLSFKLRYSNSDDYDSEAATQLTGRYTDFNCGPFTEPQPRSMFGLPPELTLEQTAMRYCGEIKAPSGPIGINTDNLASTLDALPVDKHGLWMDKSMLTATLEWEFLDGYSATLIASDQDHEVMSLFDFERTPTDSYQTYSVNEQTQQSYELRIESPADQRLTWMLGASRLDFDFSAGGAFLYGAVFGDGAGGPFSPVVVTTDNTQTNSIFGSLGYDITDNLTLNIEARRQFDKITSGVGTPTEYEIETPATLPRVLLRWQMDDENHFYLNYAEGNQPTQGYSIYFQLTEEQRVVAEENGINDSAPEATVKNYEAGWKHYSDDGRWYLNTSVYYLEWQDRQTITSLQVDLDGDGSIILEPAPEGEVFNTVPFVSGDSNTKGIELDGAYLLTPDFTIGGSASYADTEVTKALYDANYVSTFGEDDAKGKDMPLVAKLSGALYAQYFGVMLGDIEWYTRIDATYQGRRYTDSTNLSWLPSRTLINLRAGINRDDWSASVYVTNLLDDDTPTWARTQADSAADPYLFQLAGVEVALARKRQIGATFRYWF
ncbi:MAG: TonB-dependent receptor [Alteromonadaceae bacterium]|nr:TonB-dependent receptor [Alteromonadaceae bacterium]